MIKIENEKLVNILGELIMYQNKEIDRLNKCREKTTYAIIAEEIDYDIEKLKKRRNEYKVLFKSIEI